MKIATWNINSVRLRAPQILRFLKEQSPDILALQETKCPDEHFPLEAFHAAGYAHTVFSGMKGYNGVALISRVPLDDVLVTDHCNKSDCRHLAATFRLEGLKIHIHNLYIPAGGPDPDPIGNPNFKHKLDFVDEMAQWFPDNASAEEPMIVLGDLNIAPLEQDVWSHKQLLNVVSHTPIEVEKFTHMQENFGWVDAMRHFVPADEKLYTWWSYRNRDWCKSNRGRRLDHIWVTPPLVDALTAMDVFKETRDWERPSDHVPVMVELK